MITRMVLVIIRKREMTTVGIKMTATMMKVVMVDSEEEEVVLRLFLRCPTFCEAVTPLFSSCHCQRVLRGVCMLRGPLWILPPLSSISCP